MYLISQKDNIGTMTNFTTDFSWFLSVWIFTLSNTAFIIRASGPKIMTWETCVPANQDELKNLNHIFYKMRFSFLWVSFSTDQWGSYSEKQNTRDRQAHSNGGKWGAMFWFSNLEEMPVFLGHCMPLDTIAAAVPRETESSGLIFLCGSHRNRIQE